MKKYFITIFIFLTSIASGQPPAEKSLLWEITGNGLEKPSYLFGTIHILCPQDLVVSERIRAAFEKSEQLVLELKLDDPTMLSRMMQYVVLPEGQDLKKMTDEQDWDAISQFMRDSLSMSMEMFLKMKPLMLESSIIVKFLPCQPASWESTLMTMAQERKEELIGLETVEQQIAVFDKEPIRDQMKELADELRNSGKTKEMYTVMTQLYHDQDINGLSNLIEEYFKEYGDWEKSLVKERNVNWIPIIDKLTHAKSSFIAVGAGHLGGENGLISMLRAQYYKVRPIIY